jgi:hypothetical protein
MRLVVWETLPVELSAVEAEDNQAQGTFEGIGTTRKTTRFASQASQVVTKFCIICFHRIRVRFAF